MSWRSRIVNGNAENAVGTRPKSNVTTNTMGLKRSALGEIGNKVLARSNSTILKPSALGNSKGPVKPLQRSASVRTDTAAIVKKPDFVKPLPKPNVATRVKRTFSSTSVTSIALSSSHREENEAPADNVTTSKVETETVFEDVDKADENNPLLVANYVFEIYEYLQTLEDKFPIRENFLEGQQVTPRMRAILVDWLTEVQMQYHLLQETLYLAIQIIDRYLQTVPNVAKKFLQLVGVAAMFVASKYEEVYLPDISDFVFITDNTYSKQQLLAMEVQIVKALDFEFSRPISLTFLRRYSKLLEVNPIHHCFSKYFLELALLEYNLCHVKPSIIAAAALYISLCIYDLKGKKAPQLWDAKMVHYSSYNALEVEAIAVKLAAVILKAETSKLEAVKKKYSSNKMMYVATRRELQAECLKRLADGLNPFP